MKEFVRPFIELNHIATARAATKSGRNRNAQLDSSTLSFATGLARVERVVRSLKIAYAASVHATPQIEKHADLMAVLRRYWGYDSFRPLQEKIVHSLIDGHDSCVVMPTGGGKSLCYQLPAAMLPQQTVLVVSPLIALMQDQVAHLTQMGIPSAVLNSSVSNVEQSSIMRKATEGEYRLLYLSPERLARADTVVWLQRVPIALFAIDEAHCISEWGHEFRPDYRQLSGLRQNFPDRPIAAFTASATQRVRHDIIEQLRLRDPHKYIASFYRANLRYVARECDGRMQSDLLDAAMRQYARDNVIIYAPTIARVEQTASYLEGQGIPAVAYHGKMTADLRRRNQESWMTGEVRVLVGTVAFGLGIDKANVRAVIHLSLPKSIEQYYQEAGRGGRDGLPADCILLWQKRDVGLHAYFIGQMTDPAERERCWQRYHEIRRFVDSNACRHLQICSHFGETLKWKSCGACEACGYEPQWLCAPAADPRRPKRAKSAPAASAPILAAHAERAKAAPQASSPDGDAALREYLREWRRTTAKEQKVPAFVVMHDSSLDEVCRTRPATLAALLRVFGFGERKVELYGQQILDALARFRQGAGADSSPEKRDKQAETGQRRRSLLDGN